MSTAVPKGSDKKQPTVDHVALLRSFLPKIPVIARTTILHLLGCTEASKYMDLRTEVLVAVMKSYLLNPRPMSVSAAQRFVIPTGPIKGRIWISNYVCPAPEDRGIQDAVASAIQGLREGAPDSPELDLVMPEMEPVEAEWTGFRAGASPDALLPDQPQQQLYDEMMKEVTSPTTILYLHGGAFWLMDPATHRMTTKRLAKLSGGRCYSVRYRLAPQHAFPSALMDAFASYLALLYPPPGAFHTAVPPENIVFAGDSAGGNLALSLLQLLLHLRRTSTPVVWRSTTYPTIPLPAGVAVNSPWLDVTHSSPSCEANASFDYIPPRHVQLAAEPRRHHCGAWPASPPRRMMYAADALVLHPLVTVMLARDWSGAPPVWMCTGRELLTDEDKFLASRMVEDGVRLVFEEYEGMPHCFALLFEGLPEARRCMEGWAGFAKGVVEGGASKVEGKGEGARFTVVKARTAEEVEGDGKGLRPYEEGEIRGWIEERLRMDIPEALLVSEGGLAKL